MKVKSRFQWAKGHLKEEESNVRLCCRKLVLVSAQECRRVNKDVKLLYKLDVSPMRMLPAQDCHKIRQSFDNIVVLYEGLNPLPHPSEQKKMMEIVLIPHQIRTMKLPITHSLLLKELSKLNPERACDVLRNNLTKIAIEVDVPLSKEVADRFGC